MRKPTALNEPLQAQWRIEKPTQITQYLNPDVMSPPTATEDRMAAHVNGDEVIYHYGKPAALTKNLMAWIPCSTHEKCTSPCRRPGFAAAIAEGHRRQRRYRWRERQTEDRQTNRWKGGEKDGGAQAGG